MRNKSPPSLLYAQDNIAARDAITTAEFRLLETIGFDYDIPHPNVCLKALINQMGVRKSSLYRGVPKCWTHLKNILLYFVTSACARRSGAAARVERMRRER